MISMLFMVMEVVGWEQGKIIFRVTVRALRIWSRETSSAVPSRVDTLIIHSTMCMRDTRRVEAACESRKIYFESLNEWRGGDPTVPSPRCHQNSTFAPTW